MQTIQPKILEILIERKSNLTVTLVRKFQKFWGGRDILRGCPFWGEIPENAAVFACRNFHKFKPEVLVEWKVPCISAPNLALIST